MVLRAEGVEFGFRAGRPVLRGAGVEASGGTVTAVVGPNGAGKSTFLRVLLGSLRPWAGRVTLDGHDVCGMSAGVRSGRLAYISQRGGVAFAFTARQVAGLGRYGSSGIGDHAAVDWALSCVGLLERGGDPFGILSAGQQQRVSVARALAQLHGRVGVLLADEPVSAMDPRHAIETMGLLRGAARGGSAVVVVLHDLTLAARFADRALVLGSNGSPACEGPAAEALSPDVLGPVYGVRFDRVGSGGATALVPSLADAR
jgi:iron complex transport system ATP-binding protein